MAKYYYMSRFCGLGTQAEPFRARVAQLGDSGILDFRPDETQQEGWCIACVERDAPVPDDVDGDVVFLCDDTSAQLTKETVEAIKSCLGVEFKSASLADIIAEILLLQRIPGRGLRQGIDGNYRIDLRGLIWEATEDEAIEFVGKLREGQLLGASPVKRSQLSDLRPALGVALSQISDLADSGHSGWLNSEIARVEGKRSSHPLAVNYAKSKKLLDDRDVISIHNSPPAIWTLMLARDLRIAATKTDVSQFASRLRDARACEPTKYELFVMASYVGTGANVERTDKDSQGEFRVQNGGWCVHVECKHKSAKSIGNRDVKPVLDSANGQLCRLMEAKGKPAFLEICCRTDPGEEDLPALVMSVSRALEHDIEESGFRIKCGSKYEITLLPATLVASDSTVCLPAGFDYGFSELVTTDESPTGQCNARGVVWRVLRPGGWIRSVVDSVRKAASGLPPDSPNLIYIHVPPGSLGAVSTRIDLVAPEIEHLLSMPNRFTRVNAVVLTAEATLRGWGAPNIATVRYIYRTIFNSNARNALPATFRVFGRDFTRT